MQKSREIALGNRLSQVYMKADWYCTENLFKDVTSKVSQNTVLQWVESLLLYSTVGKYSEAVNEHLEKWLKGSFSQHIL